MLKVTDPFFMYMYEAEVEAPGREKAIANIIREFKLLKARGVNITNTFTQMEVCTKYGIPLSELTDAEAKKIERAINRK